VIGYIGSLVKAKGIDILVKTFSLLQNRAEMNLCLLMVGDGEHKKEIESMVREMRLHSVIVPGFRKDVVRVLAAMDVFVLPSLSEGCPFSLLEAMAAGKTIIASNIPSIKEIVEDGKEAILIDPNKSEMLKKAILRIYSDHELRDNLSKNAKRKADHYNMDTCFTEIVKLYTDYKKVN
jgi:glycosyltransferase involved in cell wall biosynthesis